MFINTMTSLETCGGSYTSSFLGAPVENEDEPALLHTAFDLVKRISGLVKDSRSKFGSTLVVDPPLSLLNGFLWNIADDESDVNVSAGPILSVHELTFNERVDTLFASWHLSDDIAPLYLDRLRTLAVALQGVGLKGGVVYEGPDEKVVVEYGQKNRTLTFLLDETQTIVMFRSGATDDFRNVAMTQMSATPATVEIQQVAKDYLISLICQTTILKETSPQTALLAAA